MRETDMQILYRFKKMPDTPRKQSISVTYLQKHTTAEGFFKLVREYVEQVEVKDESSSEGG